MVMKSEEVCGYLRISKPTLLKYIREGRVRAVKAGKGWRILQSEVEEPLDPRSGGAKCLDQV